MSKIDIIDHFLHDLEEGLEHERGQRRSLEQMVQNHHIERLEDRSKGAYSLLEYERNYHAVRDELSSAHRSFEDLRNRHEKLQHPTWQFYCVRIASSMQYTERPNELG